MNMDHAAALSAMDAIVAIAVLFAMVFFAAWLLSPRLRRWVEQPKYRFQANLQALDHERTLGKEDRTR